MATRVARNTQELQKMMEQQIIGWLTKIGEQLPKYLKEFIESEYYDQYHPSQYYDRQYRILEAIMVTSITKVGNTYNLSIYLDPSVVSYDPSVWYSPKTGSWNYIKGDTSEDVFNLMSQGIHGAIENGQTEGRFWETFLESVGHGGIYDIFEDFQRYLSGTGLFVIG